MSKKTNNSRFNTLFSSLAEKAAPPPEQQNVPAGWTWECDRSYRYISCSPDAGEILLLDSHQFLGQDLRTFLLTESSTLEISQTLAQAGSGFDAALVFQAADLAQVTVRMTFFQRFDENDDFDGWRGFAQVLSRVVPPPPATAAATPQPLEEFRAEFQPVRMGYQFGPSGMAPAGEAWTSAARESLSINDAVIHNEHGIHSLALPIRLQGQPIGFAELIDEKGQPWSQDDRLLVQEVTQQLALALENAQLYATVQHELVDRIRAERETQRRNQDLSALNQIGRQLNRLSSPMELLEQIAVDIGLVIDNRNLVIALFDEYQNAITFPIYTIQGERLTMPGRSFRNGLTEYILTTRAPFLAGENIVQLLDDLHIDQPEPSPLSLIGVPLLVGDQAIGVFLAQSFDHQHAFTEYQLDLLTTIAAQTTTALENARLFQQMQSTLLTIEVRERYQKNVARSIATLTEVGSQSLGEVLHLLAIAAQTSRVYYAHSIHKEGYACWEIKDIWTAPGTPSFHKRTGDPVYISIDRYAFLANELQEQGRICGSTSIMPSPERELLQSLGIRSFLALAVPGQEAVPGFLGFDDTGYERPWGTEEIDALQMASASLSNTYIRENLLDQLTLSLDESENLYSSSRRLGVANGLQEILSALVEGLRVPSINRAELILFTYSTQAEMTSARVAANWYGGYGTTPAPLETVFGADALKTSTGLLTTSPIFIDHYSPETESARLSPEVIDPTTTSSLGILPLLVGKKQIGVVVLYTNAYHAFTDKEKRAYPPLIGQMAIAVENLSLFQQTEIALGETETLYQASEELNRAKTLEEILHILGRYTVIGLNSHKQAICLFHQPLSALSFPEDFWIAAHLPTASGSPPSHPTVSMRSLISADKFISAAAPTLIHDIQTFPDLIESARAYLHDDLGAVSALFVPLLVGEHWIGFIGVLYPQQQAFQDSDSKQLTSLAGQAAVVIQNLRSIESSQQRADEAILLFQTSRHFLQAKNEGEMLKIALGTCYKGVHSDGISIDLMFFENSQLFFEQAAHISGTDMTLPPDGSRFPAINYPFTDLLLNGQTVTSDNLREDSRLDNAAREQIQKSQVASAILLPLQVRQQNIGVLKIFRGEQSPFTNAETTFLQTVATQFSVSLDNFRLLHEAQHSAKEARQRSEELSLINRVVSSVAASLDLRTGLRIVINELSSAFALPSGNIFLLDESKSRLMIVADYAEDAQTSIGLRFSIEPNSAAQQVITTRKPLSIQDALTNPLTQNANDFVKLRNIHDLVMLPLATANEVIGIVQLNLREEGQALTADEIRLAETVIYQAAAAIQNSRLFEQSQNALAETELLYKMTRSLAQATNAQGLLETVFQLAMPKAADRVSLFIIHLGPNQEPNGLELAGYYDIEKQFRPSTAHFPPASLPILNSLHNECQYVPDVQHAGLDPVTNRTLSQLSTAAFCLVPLRSAGRLVGLLLVSSKKPATYTPQEVHVLQIMNDSFAVALEKQRLLTEAQRRALELQSAAEIARDTSGTLALDSLLKRAVQMVGQRFKINHVGVYLIDEFNRYAVIREATGKIGEELIRSNHRLPVDRTSVIGMAALSSETLVVNDVRTNTIYLANPLLHETRSELVIPLKIGQRVIGVLDFESNQVGYFQSDDVNVLQLLSDQIAVAIENARAYELAQKAITEIRELDRLKSQFLANMSHELRTPLNSIIGFSRVILKGIDGPITEMMQVDLTAIYNSGQHLLQLINDVLDLSKIEAGKMELAFEEIDLPELVKGAVTTAAGLIKDKPIKIVKNIPSNLPVIQADQMRIRQVLINFLSNAAKFTDQGTITLEAAVVTSPEGSKEVMVMVTDTGAGIAPEDSSKLFQAFSQVDDSPARKTGGTGLGLSICRSLIEMHGGRIGLLRSEINKGSTFFFTLPVKGQPARLELPSGPAAGETAFTVLAISADAQAAGMIQQRLEQAGYQVVTLTDPAQAVETAARLQPLAIVLDIHMTSPQGWRVLHQIKNDPETRQIPIVVCAVQANQSGYSFGAIDYLVKPAPPEELLDTLRQHNLNGGFKQILVVNDNPDERQLIQQVLRDQGSFETLQLDPSGQNAINLTGKQPDAAIIDLFSGDMIGLALFEELRGRTDTAEIPIILMGEVHSSDEDYSRLDKWSQELLARHNLPRNDLLNAIQAAIRQLQPQVAGPAQLHPASSQA
jgi:GAF domain-containing protein/CheY-like chemotaxis protein